MTLSRPNHTLGLRRAGGGSHEQSRLEHAWIEAALESIAERGQVSGRMLAEVECMVAATQAGLQIAGQGVDPLERGQVLRFAPADDGRQMRAACSEAGQPIGEHGATRGQMRPGPPPDRIQAQARDGGEFDAQGASLVTEGDSGNERQLVFRALTDFAPATFTTQAGIIELDLPVEKARRLTFGHRLHQLVVDAPSRRVAHPKVALECERRQPGAGLADQVEREEPDRQRQFGALHHGEGDQRGLMPARLALEQCVGSPTHPAASGAVAARAPKPRRPPRLFQRSLACPFSSVAVQKLGHRQSRLKLDSVHWHGAPLSSPWRMRIRACRYSYISMLLRATAYLLPNKKTAG